MSALAILLEERTEMVIERWLERVRAGAATEGLSVVELRDHVPLFVRELADGLRAGRPPASSRAAKEHGEQREELGFAVDAVVREYGVLLDVILDVAEAEARVPTIADVRVMSRFFALGIEGSVAAHARRQDRLARKHEALAGAEQRRAEAATRRLEGLFRTAPAFMAALHGPLHVFRLVNAPYQRLVGAGRALVGLPVAEALPEVVAQGYIRLLDEVYRTGTPFEGSEIAVRLDRGGASLEDAFVDFVYQPTRDEMGAVDGIDVFGFDVTEQVRARRAVEDLVADVRAKEAEIKSVVDAMPLLVSFVTADERYGLVNRAYEDWFGIRAEELQGQRVADVIGPQAYAVLGPYVKRGLSGERFSFEQHAVPYRLGETRDVAVTFVKANIGLSVRETPRDVAFCAHAILDTKTFVVNDATADARFADHPMVTGHPDIRFYAGVPLVNPEGFALGTLCAIDTKPRQLTAEQERGLAALGRQVMAQLELRRAILELETTLAATATQERPSSSVTPMPVSMDVRATAERARLLLGQSGAGGPMEARIRGLLARLEVLQASSSKR